MKPDLTETEKARQGFLYRFDAQLTEERKRAQQIVFEYNHFKPSDIEQKAILLKRLLGAIGENCIIEPPFYCDFGHNIFLGNDVFANVNLVILDCAKVSIGDDVLIAPNVGIYTAKHPIDPKQRKQKYEYALPITIGNNVWIGAGASILPNVTIGDNSIIGAGSVVTKSIPPDVIAVGNPCKVIKKLSCKECS
ncbi:MAG: sugar O-acetyltransferase [Endomicrobium sp.]|jgi:acetyltransferase-like isoleucine patch superfamily enzyme|nr:sugar O-acetyltransferase [Endomicrobium sp.]